MSGESRLRRLLTDRRARVPFALIGIFLLLSSALFFYHVETSEEPTESLDVDLAMERTEAGTQTATRDAVTQASEQAAKQPLTESAETPYGNALDNVAQSSDDGTFKTYLRALVYLEAQNQYETVGQEVGDVETEVRLPEITDPDSFESAIEQVDLTFGSETADGEPGVVEAEISNVTTVGTHNGEEVARETDSIEVAVATPVKQLHNRTETFQDRLDAGISESGFTQRFNARIYALGWARGYAQYSGMPVTEVIANRHVVPSANDAVYRTQKDVFGEADPQLNNAIRRGWLCMAMHDAEGLYGGYGSADGDDEYADDLCEASDWLFGDQASGNPPDAPSTMDLMENAPGLDAEHTVGVNSTSYPPLRQLASTSDEHSISRAIDRVFEVETELTQSLSNVERPTFDHNPPERFEAGQSTHLGTSNIRTSVSVRDVVESNTPDELATITGEVDIELKDKKEHTFRDENGTDETITTSEDTLSAEFELQLSESEVSPNANIDDYNTPDPGINPANKYEPGPPPSEIEDETVPTGNDPAGFQNYKGIVEDSLRQLVGNDYQEHLFINDSVEDEDIEDWLESEWGEATKSSEMDVEESVTASSSNHIYGSGLEDAILSNLTQLQEQASDITIQFKRSDVLHDGSGTGPYGELREKVAEEKREYLERQKPYENVGQKAVYEAQYSYFKTLESDLDRLDSAHGSAMSQLDVELEDTGLGDALSYLQQGVTAEPPDPEPVESPELTDDIHYEVSGSPTYLVTENTSSEDVPPVDNDVENFAPMAAQNENHLKLPYESVVEGLLSRLGNIIGISDPDAELTLRMAGEALEAGELAEDASRSGEYGNEDILSSLTDEFEDSVDTAVEEFSSDVADQIKYHLYPDDFEVPCTEEDDWCGQTKIDDIEDVHDDISCPDGVCEYNGHEPEACREVDCAIEDDSPLDEAEDDIEDVVEDTVARYSSSPAETAIAIDEGDITEPLVENLGDELDSDTLPGYASSTDGEETRSLIRSAAQPAVTSSANAGEVTLSDTDTVEELDTEVRQTLEEVGEDMTEERFEEHFGDGEFDLEEYDDWVDGVRTPVRVPAGMPLLPVPNAWFATVNAWDVEVNGQYARFEVTANMGTPETADGTTYVRENQSVEIAVANGSKTVGQVEPIAFEGRSSLIVVVPPGGIGVGDRDDEDPECSPTWPAVGDVETGEIRC